MKPTEIKRIFSEIGGGAHKKLGQHFLMDEKVLETVVETADIRAGDLVLEIGPGLGVLTRALLARGAEVVAMEQDRRFVEYLNSKGKIQNAKLTLIHGDAARLDWHEHIRGRPWKFVSNLPYSITSLALRRALWAPRPPESVVVLVQREVAERAVDTANSKFKIQNSKKGKTSLLSLMVALASSSARIVRRVPAEAFYPPPKVESAVLKIIPISWEERRRRWHIEPDKIMEIARRGFAHPRKMLKSNLVRSPQSAVLSPVGIDEKARAEDLSPDEWAKLARAVMSG